MFVIYNDKTKHFEPHYNSNTMPALYQSRTTAEGILKRRQKYGGLKDYRVAKIKIEVRD